MRSGVWWIIAGVLGLLALRANSYGIHTGLAATIAGLCVVQALLRADAEARDEDGRYDE